MEIRSNKWEKQRKLGLDKGLRDAVADYLGRKYPANTAKLSARRFDLTVDQARGAVAGKASLAAIERIFKTGGWTVALVILADVIGTSIAKHLTELRATHEKDGERLREVGRNLWIVAPDRHPLRADPDPGRPGRRRSVGD